MARKKKIGRPRRIRRPDLAKRNRKVTPRQWVTIKHRWLKDGSTFALLADEYGISEQLIKQKSVAQSWADDKPKFQYDMTQRMRELFIKAGLPPEKLVEMITRGATETKMLATVKEVQAWTRKFKNGRTVKGKPFTLEKTVQVIDNTNTRKYREMINQMIGGFAPPKSSVKIENGKNGNGKRHMKIELITVRTKKDARAFKNEQGNSNE